MSEGNGDAKLVYFGARVTPNQTRSASDSSTGYASCGVATRAITGPTGRVVNDYAERMWPLAYGNRKR